MTDSKFDLAGFHQDVLMEDMLKAVGVEPLDIVDLDGGHSYIHARAKCHVCPCKKACSEWLVENKEGDPQAFCPNGELFKLVKD